MQCTSLCVEASIGSVLYIVTETQSTYTERMKRIRMKDVKLYIVGQGWSARVYIELYI